MIGQTGHHSLWAEVLFCETYGIHPRFAPPKLRQGQNNKRLNEMYTQEIRIRKKRFGTAEGMISRSASAIFEWQPSDTTHKDRWYIIHRKNVQFLSPYYNDNRMHHHQLCRNFWNDLLSAKTLKGKAAYNKFTKTLIVEVATFEIVEAS